MSRAETRIISNYFRVSYPGILLSMLSYRIDPDYEVIKKTRPASNKTPDERMAYLVVAIVQEGNNKQFRVCLMSQNRAVQGRMQDFGEGGVRHE